jgi:hypothetical protein
MFEPKEKPVTEAQERAIDRPTPAITWVTMTAAELAQKEANVTNQLA